MFYFLNSSLFGGHKKSFVHSLVFDPTGMCLMLGRDLILIIFPMSNRFP